MNNQVLPNQALLLEWPSHGGWWLLTHLQPQWRTRWNSDRRIHVGRERERDERKREATKSSEESQRYADDVKKTKTYVELLTSWHHVSEMKKPIFLKRFILGNPQWMLTWIFAALVFCFDRISKML